jgi:ABC-type multidrug transport system ATPase subunit
MHHNDPTIVQMGSSGAGKTTLLDVLAGRKNTGTTTGGTFVNGRKVNTATFKHIMGYVEQFDSLSPRDTAREAVEFSAALRLPRETSAQARSAWVSPVLSMLELTPIENTMIGNEEVSGLSFEQKKRVSIAVELAANPSVLFLDEPTTGLDSRAAQVVIRCIKRVASSGRTVVCTIHQPSAVIFEAFDSLLLLRRGGQTVYFGELGEHSCHMVSYLEGVPNVSSRQPGTNPATWMLEVIGAGTSGGANANVIDFHAYYLQSALCAVNTARVDALVTTALSPADLESGNLVVVKDGTECGFVPVLCGTVHDLLPDRDAIPAHTYNASYVTQFRMLMYRFLMAYWRSPTYNFVRMVVSVVIALIFSSTYADQKYTTNVDVIARVAVVYVTLLFMGIVGMKSVQPVILEERPAFYREMYCKMYDIKLYVVAGTLVEVTRFPVYGCCSFV